MWLHFFGLSYNPNLTLGTICSMEVFQILVTPVGHSVTVDLTYDKCVSGHVREQACLQVGVCLAHKS